MVQKAAIYCRVSTSDQSCERQERELLQFANRGGYEIVAIFKETASGAKADRKERKKLMALAQRREIDVILVSELTRWGRSTSDLLDTLTDLHSFKVSVIALNGFQFDLNSAQGRLLAGVMALLAEFERDLLRERIKSGLASAQARGKVLGRAKGDRYKSDRLAPKVLAMIAEKRSYRYIAKELQVSKTTIVDIVKRDKQK